MDINKKIYRNVKALSAIRRIDMKEVEARIGRTPGYLSRKSTKIDVETLINLAAMFGVQNDELMNGDFELEQKRIEVTNSVRETVLEAKNYISESVLKEMLVQLIENSGTTEGGDDDVHL